MADLWLVVDTNVLVDASGQGVKDFAPDSHKLLKNLANIREFLLALDSKKKILMQYEARIRAPMFAFHWLERLRNERRIQPVNFTGVPKGSRVELQEAHFDTTDYPLVEAALYSSKIIVTRDFKSFTEQVQTILRRRLKIRIFSASMMLKQLGAGGSNHKEVGPNAENPLY